MPTDPARWLPLLDAIADRADAIALDCYRNRRLRVEAKPDDSPVTAADRAIEEAARALVRARHPELGVFGEEEGATGERGAPRLIIDPIDSTRNFIRGIPIFGTLLAIEEGDDVVAGLVSAPALGTRWHGVRGAGAFQDGRQIRVSTVERLEGAQVFHGDIGARSERAPPAGFAELVRRAARTRGFGDFYQHVLVAQGAGEVAIDPSVSPWDVAPLLVIVEEAGGRCTSLAGARTIYGGSWLSTNGRLHDEVLRLLTGGAAGPTAR